MRSSHRRIATIVVLSLVVVACGPAPSPNPVTTPPRPSDTPASPSTSPTTSAAVAPTPIPTPTSSPALAAWPYSAVSGQTTELVFGPDGTVYLLAGVRDAEDRTQTMLVALDAAGRVKPGWPIQETAGSDFGTPAVGPDGSIYLEECGGPDIGCVLHRLGIDGRELPGWPFEVPPAFACPDGGLCYSILDIGSDGTAYLTHWRSAGGLQAMAIDASGEIRPGWPVAPDGKGVYWSNAQLSADGTLFMLRKPDGIEGSPRLAAFGPDGRVRSGWPVSVPDIGGYVLGPKGNVVTWSLIDDVGELCSNPRRTVYTALGPDGRTLRGWPRGSKGFASPPVVDSAGTVYYVSALGNVYAHDRAGEVKTGWPVPVHGAGNGCGPASPYLAPDGTIFVLGDEVEARSPDGTSRPGWPYRPAGDLISPVSLDTDSVAYPSAPAFGRDGTVYLVLFHTEPAGARAEIVALDRQGRLKPGWPYRLPFDLTSVGIGPLAVSPDGRLFVLGGDSLLALDPDGRLSE